MTKAGSSPEVLGAALKPQALQTLKLFETLLFEPSGALSVSGKDMKDLAEEEARNLGGWFEDQRKAYQDTWTFRRASTGFYRFLRCSTGFAEVLSVRARKPQNLSPWSLRVIDPLKGILKNPL